MKSNSLDNEVREILDRIASKIVSRIERKDMDHTTIEAKCCEIAKYMKEPVMEI